MNDAELRTQIGQAIGRERVRCGLTQQGLADLLGSGRAPTVSSWENGKATPDAATLRRLAEIFGVPTDTLVGLSGADGDSYTAGVLAGLQRVEELVAEVRRDYASRPDASAERFEPGEASASLRPPGARDQEPAAPRGTVGAGGRGT